MLFRSLSLALALAAACATVSVPLASASTAPAFAAYVDDAFTRYGWTPRARDYLRDRVDVAVDPADVPNTRKLAGMYVGGRIVVWDPFKMGDWLYETLSHEYAHALEDARGGSPATAGPLLYDLLQVAQDETYPEAAWAARHLLQLRDGPTGDWMLDGYYDRMVDRKDYAHLLLALLERGAGFDVSRVPPWFREAYYPHLTPSPPNPYPVRVRARAEPPPADVDARLLRVKNLVAELCGPKLSGVTASPSRSCVSRKRWPGVPFEPLPGAEGRGPAAPAARPTGTPVAQSLPPVAAVTLPPPPRAETPAAPADLPAAASDGDHDSGGGDDSLEATVSGSD